jgi:two-component sensor histidine kinase
MSEEITPEGTADNSNDAAMTEKLRLNAVRRYDVLDTPPDGAFDRVTTIAAQVLKVPIAIISIVDHDRIWFKSHHGLDVEQIDRDPGLCASCILQGGPWIVNDAKADPRALANPLVAGEFGLQFYFGIPLRTRDGFNLGTLCVIDFAPRVPSHQDVTVLTNLAAVVMDELELRLSARNAIADYQQELVRREQREEHIRALLRELAHRSKNLLSVVQAIAMQTVPNSQTIHDYVTRLAGRVQALGHTHDLIADEDWQGVTLHDLAARQLAPFVDTETMRVHCDGPQLVLRPVAAQNIGLALHELASNAVKYGALSVPEGKIDLTWYHAGPRLGIAWRERDGPPAKVPSRKGFGHVVLTRLAPEALDGRATMSFDPGGFHWNLDFPTTHVH